MKTEKSQNENKKKIEIRKKPNQKSKSEKNEKPILERRVAEEQAFAGGDVVAFFWFRWGWRFKKSFSFSSLLEHTIAGARNHWSTKP